MVKGNIVLVRPNADLWRPITTEEREAWREEKRAAIAAASAAGEDTFSLAFDSAGEPRLAPRSVYRSETEGEWTVVRARCRVGRGWYTETGCTLIRHSDGTEWYTFRKNVFVVGEGTGAKAKPKAPSAGIDRDIEAWVAKVNERFGGTRTIARGRKYAKIVNGGSVYCFVDRTNGDILKAASWKAPAKHARGNIYDADPLKGVGPYGAAYLA